MAGEEIGHQTDLHINYLDKTKCSPLHLAVRGGNIEAIRFCIESGAKVDQQQVLMLQQKQQKNKYADLCLGLFGCHLFIPLCQGLS